LVIVYGMVTMYGWCSYDYFDKNFKILNNFKKQKIEWIDGWKI
jgi:hypothetical protein